MFVFCSIQCHKKECFFILPSIYRQSRVHADHLNIPRETNHCDNSLTCSVLEQTVRVLQTSEISAQNSLLVACKHEKHGISKR